MSKLELEDLCKGCGFYDVCKTRNEKNILKNEIRELKTLLKECQHMILAYSVNHDTFTKDKVLDTVKQIDNAIGNTDDKK